MQSSTKIEPTVGRVMWYHPRAGDMIGKERGEQPLAAMVAHVNDDGTVNLVVYDVWGNPASRTRVLLVQPDQAVEANAEYCHWMPYQVGQARAAGTEHGGAATG